MEPRFTAISLTMLALRSNIGGVVISLYEHSPWPVLVQATGLYTSKLGRCRKVAASIASSPHCPNHFMQQIRDETGVPNNART